MSRHRVPPKPRAYVIKNRRAFRAWLIFSLSQIGIEVSGDPTYVELKTAVEALIARAGVGGEP